ncbi:unnamed protein product [Pleuronectes platessa]|uniref:Uncharacterized protein n=1 Tax=Pleuronectes platessa TaxID=8262 RepID=A0A9N7YED3_PLEPL|nr:unnamed protein product [Pleuronectes platessa]
MRSSLMRRPLDLKLGALPPPHIFFGPFFAHTAIFPSLALAHALGLSAWPSCAGRDLTAFCVRGAPTTLAGRVPSCWSDLSSVNASPSSSPVASFGVPFWDRLSAAVFHSAFLLSHGFKPSMLGVGLCSHILTFPGGRDPSCGSPHLWTY